MNSSEYSQMDGRRLPNPSAARGSRALIRSPWRIACIIIATLWAGATFAFTLVGSSDTAGTANEVEVVGSIAYVADGPNGLVVLDVNDPTSPVSLGGFVNVGGFSEDVQVANGLAYVADAGLGVTVLDVSDPSNITLVGSFNTGGSATGIQVSNGLAYVADGSGGLLVLDVSDPANVNLFGSFDTTGFANSVDVVNSLAYVADGLDGMVVLDVSDPFNVTFLGSFDTAGTTVDVRVVGSLAYLADSSEGLLILDVSDPSNITSLGSYDTAGETQDVQIVTNLAYLADGTGGLVVVDVSDPANITLVDGLDTLNDARGLYVDGDLVYLADSGSGLQIAAAVGPPTQISINAGDGQTAVAGEAVAIAPSVIVQDANDYPVAGVDVTFAVASGGGSVTGPVATTDASGIASVGSWTLGATAGSNTLNATAPGLSDVTFTATGTVGAATQMTIDAGDGQTAVAGEAVAIAPSVIVQDANDNPVEGAEVTFAVASGGGSVTAAVVTTNASGIASVGSWTLGTTAGSNTLDATAPGLSDVTFTATGTFGAATQMAINAGDGQSAVAGEAVAIAPSVIVQDANDNPVEGVEVTFAVASRGGSVTATVATTNASGIASVGSWTLGATAGSNTLNATAPGLSDVTFTATGTVGAATQMTINAGDGQSATVGSALSVAPSVLVTDANDNPVEGAEVTFVVASGGGTVTDAVATSDASGIAVVGSWTLGTTAGTNTLMASAAGPADVMFTATGTADTAAQMTINAGDGQSATAGSAVPIAPNVLVTDANDNPVEGMEVTFAVASGNGSVTGPVATTDASGLASVGSWTLGVAPATNTLTATATGLSGVTFTATGTVGAATQMAINAGDGQTAIAGEAVAIAPSVIVQDANDNPVPGVVVTFTVASGGGVVDPTTPVITDANGVAAVTSWVLGSAAGINTLTASVAGIAEPVSFTGTGIQAIPVPALGPWALLMLLLVMFGAALPALLRRGGA